MNLNPEQKKEKSEPMMRAIATGAECKSHTVTDTASQGGEMKMTKADLDWNERTKEAGAGQEEDGSDYELELKDRPSSELLKATKVSDLLRCLSDADEDKKGTADYDTRAPATQAALGSHIDPEAAATSKKEHANNRVGVGDKDSVVDQEKLSGKGVVPIAVRIIDPIDHLASTNIKYKRPLQSLLTASLEVSEILQNELVARSRSRVTVPKRHTGTPPPRLMLSLPATCRRATRRSTRYSRWPRLAQERRRMPVPRRCRGTLHRRVSPTRVLKAVVLTS